MKNNVSPLKIALHGMDNRLTKTMMLFLQGPCEGFAIVVNTGDDADVDLFDADASASRELLNQHLQHRINKPVIVQSLNDFPHEGVLQLKKPIKREDMLAVLKNAKTMAAQFASKVEEADQPKTSWLENADDDVDIFKDDFFDYLTTSSWDDDDLSSGEPEKFERKVEAVESDGQKQAETPKPTSESHSTSIVAEKTASKPPLPLVSTQKSETLLSEPTIEAKKAGLVPGQSVKPEITTTKIADEPEVANVDDEPELKTFVKDTANDKSAKHETAKRMNEKAYLDHFSIADDVDLNYPDHLEKSSYNPKDYLQGFFQDAWVIASEKDRHLAIQSPWFPIILFPDKHQVWVDANDFELNAFAVTKLNLKSMDSQITVTSVDHRMADAARMLNKFQDKDAFVWKLACWSSNGHFPQDIDHNKPIYLKSWPNFTRLLVTPYALRIAALLIRGPRTMPNIAETLNIRIQFVFMFVSAAKAIGIAGQANRVADSAIQPSTIKPSKAQGLLGRIINRLLK